MGIPYQLGSKRQLVFVVARRGYFVFVMEGDATEYLESLTVDRIPETILSSEGSHLGI